jgi:DNA/RNA-binding domain of Phe-tRNA-synthetase-like protein
MGRTPIANPLDGASNRQSVTMIPWNSVHTNKGIGEPRSMAKTKIAFPPQLELKLHGWDLLWAQLEIDKGAADTMPLLESLAGNMSKIMRGQPLSEHRIVQSVRSLFRNAGCDPTQDKPSSEALARRVIKGATLPSILPAVDVNNAWSVKLLVPCCVINPAKLSGDILFRRGQPGEIMDSMRGPLSLEGKPVLVDASGPFGTPVTDAERVKVTSASGTYWLVAYLPNSVVAKSEAAETLHEIVGTLKGYRVTIEPT